MTDAKLLAEPFVSRLGIGQSDLFVQLAKRQEKPACFRPAGGREFPVFSDACRQQRVGDYPPTHDLQGS